MDWPCALTGKRPLKYRAAARAAVRKGVLDSGNMACGWVCRIRCAGPLRGLGLVRLPRLFPVMGQEVGHTSGQMRRDALEHVREPLLGIDPVQFARAQ